ncbi:hypothetical protein [Curtobacterium flaccumfaciens]|uniref:hypothetical protein n=1 Tax=Curtobacterium flaccumfaciens TaxID=2035 RepID=UPI0021C5F647|nr:hypothetical protein N8D75_10030 [Curtobacterium flaccumfaciens]
MSTIDQTLRAVPDRTSSWLGSTLEDSASSGVTVSTRRDPAAKAPQVARTTATTGSTSSHGT